MTNFSKVPAAEVKCWKAGEPLRYGGPIKITDGKAYLLTQDIQDEPPIPHDHAAHLIGAAISKSWIEGGSTEPRFSNSLKEASDGKAYSYLVAGLYAGC